jgi:hypothetical protein
LGKSEKNSVDKQKCDKEENSLQPGEGRSKAGPSFRRIKDASSMVSELREGDGLDPRFDHRRRQRARNEGKPDYAAARLASQISRCVGGNLGTDLLADFEVQSVTPGKGNNFVVLLSPIDPTREYDPKLIQQAAADLLPRLRAELAQAIHRKKVPNLTFQISPATRDSEDNA